MNKATLRMLNSSEQELLRAVEPDALKELDEEALLELHTRVRRARTKYTKLYRRRASAQVRSDSSRAKASGTHSRTKVKAEVFETALARVSRHLAKAAKASAAQLRDERLAAARAVKETGKPRGKGGAKPDARPPRSAKKQRRTPDRKRAAAQARSTTRSKQAKRDSR